MPKIMSYDRKMYPCVCADCGKNAEVPFQPKEGKPVYCRECLPKHRTYGSKRF
ncbi:MAG: CxxC-x17-CxxC domain-containing protein [Nitrosopumilaceae archaeon]